MKSLFLTPAILLFGLFTIAQQHTKHRIIVLTDIEADPDDAQSLIRFLTYSNQWDVEGLIATTSIHQKDRVFPETIHDILNGYAKIHPNLQKHEKGYPAAELLRTRVKKGLAVYGMEGVGESKDSEGSEWIIKVLEKPDERPIWISVWGGPNTLAQAMWKIRKNKSQSEAERLFKKIRIYTISDQDDSGPWIRKTFPGMFYVCTPGYQYMTATWLGIAFNVPGANKEVVSKEWLATNIQQGHGPFGALYPDVAYGMEGDTPAFLSLINNGLNIPEQPDKGGWGGRYEWYTPPLTKETPRKDWPVTERETGPLWTNADDSVYIAAEKKGYKNNFATIWRWREEFQNDFAARMDWTTNEFKATNHPPVARLNHAADITLKSGEKFFLDAKGTTDPDGDSMSYLWFQYKEAGSYDGYISFAPYASNLYRLPFTAPQVSKTETIHIILKVTDKGSPALTRYRRVVVTVQP
jgi:hypothetical protein